MQSFGNECYLHRLASKMFPRLAKIVNAQRECGFNDDTVQLQNKLFPLTPQKPTITVKCLKCIQGLEEASFRVWVSSSKRRRIPLLSASFFKTMNIGNKKILEEAGGNKD